jgi:hypothetical protein
MIWTCFKNASRQNPREGLEHESKREMSEGRQISRSVLQDGKEEHEKKLKWRGLGRPKAWLLDNMHEVETPRKKTL